MYNLYNWESFIPISKSFSLPNVSFVVLMDNFSAFILKLVVLLLFSTLLILNIICQKTFFFDFINVCPHLVFKTLFVTGVKTVTFIFWDQGISAKQCQQVSVSLSTITYWNIQIIKNIQYLRNTKRYFFFFLEKFKYYVNLTLLHYLHFFQEAVFITDNWFFEGSLFITILSGIEYPSVLVSFLLFKWKYHEGWGVWLKEV